MHDDDDYLHVGYGYQREPQTRQSEYLWNAHRVR